MPTFLLAVAAAGFASWVFGAVWYTVLGKPWQTALGLDPGASAQAGATPKDPCKGQKMPLAPLVVALLAALVMAAVLHQLLLGMGMLGVMTVWDGALAGFTVGAGFVLMSTLVNNLFQGRKLLVTVIDGAHWVLALAIQGAVIAALT